MSKAEEQSELRTYLLGQCEDEEKMDKIEERLMLDSDYFQRLLEQEEELIEDYVDDSLPADELKAFEHHFLIPTERREKVRFARLLKKHTEDKTPPAPEEKPERGKWEKLLRFFLSPAPAFGLILIISVSALLFWRYYYSYDPDTRQALLSLNKAYAAARPFESRISGLDYAPFNKNRGDETVNESVDQNRAERIALDKTAESPTAENRHLLARVYLAQKKFDPALRQLEEARRESPENAEIASDIGTVYLEKSKTVADGGEKLKLVATAIENFDKALSINPDLPAARFNKAIATEIYLPNRAKEAWQKYLQIDQTSSWANEARNRLELLNKQQTQKTLTAEQLETAFIKAYNDQSDETAFQVISQNRELINGKYLPQRFSMTLAKKKTKNPSGSNS